MLEEISISLHACMSIHRYIPKYFHTIYIHMMFFKNILVKLLHFVSTMCRLNGTHYHSLIHSYIYIYEPLAWTCAQIQRSDCEHRVRAGGDP